MRGEFTGMLEGENAQPLYTIEPKSLDKEDEGEEYQKKTEENWQRLEQE